MRWWFFKLSLSLAVVYIAIHISCRPNSSSSVATDDVSDTLDRVQDANGAAISQAGVSSQLPVNTEPTNAEGGRVTSNRNEQTLALDSLHSNGDGTSTHGDAHEANSASATIPPATCPCNCPGGHTLDNIQVGIIRWIIVALGEAFQQSLCARDDLTAPIGLLLSINVLFFSAGPSIRYHQEDSNENDHLGTGTSLTALYTDNEPCFDQVPSGQKCVF